MGEVQVFSRGAALELANTRQPSLDVVTLPPHISSTQYSFLPKSSSIVHTVRDGVMGVFSMSRMINGVILDGFNRGKQKMLDDELASKEIASTTSSGDNSNNTGRTKCDQQAQGKYLVSGKKGHWIYGETLHLIVTQSSEIMGWKKLIGVGSVHSGSVPDLMMRQTPI